MELFGSVVDDLRGLILSSGGYEAAGEKCQVCCVMIISNSLPPFLSLSLFLLPSLPPSFSPSLSLSPFLPPSLPSSPLSPQFLYTNINSLTVLLTNTKQSVQANKTSSSSSLCITISSSLKVIMMILQFCKVSGFYIFINYMYISKCF